MTDDLARRLAAHPRFEWRVGMLAVWNHDETDNDRPMVWRCSLKHSQWHQSPYVSCGPLGAGHLVDNPDSYPVLTDSATAGVLLGMLLTAIEERGGRGIMRMDSGKPWIIVNAAQEDPVDPWGPVIASAKADTLGEAVARALLAVWGDE